jgi:hypothetical protein
MTDRLPGSVVSGKNNRSKRLPKTIILVIAVIIIGCFLYNHFHKNAKKTFTAAKPATASQVESLEKKSTGDLLSKGDTAGYQIAQRTLANQYLLNNDTKDAERIMNNVINSIPADKITSGTYYVMVNIEKQKKDQTQYKHYLELLIEKLKAENNPQTADQVQKVLDSLK